jgi:hypothetical protein
VKDVSLWNSAAKLSLLAGLRACQCHLAVQAWRSYLFRTPLRIPIMDPIDEANALAKQSSAKRREFMAVSILRILTVRGARTYGVIIEVYSRSTFPAGG